MAVMQSVEDVPRNKTPARVYYIVLIVIFLALFLDSVISLGSFGVVQGRVNNLASIPQCILFGTFIRFDQTLQLSIIDFSRIGSCAFVLWGQVSIVIVSFVWIGFCVVQAVIAPNM